MRFVFFLAYHFKCVSSSFRFFCLFYVQFDNCSQNEKKKWTKKKNIKYCCGTRIFECSNTDSYIIDRYICTHTQKNFDIMLGVVDIANDFLEILPTEYLFMLLLLLPLIFFHPFLHTHTHPLPTRIHQSTHAIPCMCFVRVYVRLSFQLRIDSRVHIDSFVDYCSMSSVCCECCECACVCVCQVNQKIYIIHILQYVYIRIDRLMRRNRKYVLLDTHPLTKCMNACECIKQLHIWTVYNPCLQTYFHLRLTNIWWYTHKT